jgi:4'-phosphopantetheinyl transferase
MRVDTPESCALRDGEIDVWCVELNRPAEQARSLLQILAPDERNRAERFHFPSDRRHFINARGMLRVLLGRYLGMPPAGLQFCYGPFGKPSLAPQFGGDTLRFNVSHSHELALYALTRGREIGIDIEYIRAGFAGDEMAEGFFSPREVETLRALPEDLKTQAFFNCWTRKEAYVKARGEGLSLPLKQFDVAFTPGERASLLYVQDAPSEPLRWSLRELTPAADYAAALVVEGRDCRVRFRCWPDMNTFSA